MQRIKPDHGTDRDDGYAVRNESPVEDDETDGDMVLLQDGEYRDEECHDEEDAKHQASWLSVFRFALQGKFERQIEE